MNMSILLLISILGSSPHGRSAPPEGEENIYKNEDLTKNKIGFHGSDS